MEYIKLVEDRKNREKITTAVKNKIVGVWEINFLYSLKYRISTNIKFLENFQFSSFQIFRTLNFQTASLQILEITKY